MSSYHQAFHQQQSPRNGGKAANEHQRYHHHGVSNGGSANKKEDVMMMSYDDANIGVMKRLPVAGTIQRHVSTPMPSHQLSSLPR